MFFLKHVTFELILNIYPSFSWNPLTQVLNPWSNEIPFLEVYFLTNSKPMEGGWDSEGKHIFGKDKLRLEMKNKLKSGLENKYFANRPSCKRMVKNSMYDQTYFSLLHKLSVFFLTVMTVSTCMLGRKKPSLLGGSSTMTEGKKDLTLLLVDRDRQQFEEKNNQSLWETCFPGTFSNNILTSVKQIFINTRIINAL